MPWSDTEGYWVDGVASSDRTRSGGGVEFYDPIYGFGITAQNEGSVLADIPRLVSQLQHKYVKKKCSQRALKLIFTTFADFTDFTQEFHARNGQGGRASSGDTPLTHDESLVLCDGELPKLRSNDHLQTDQVRTILAVLTHNHHNNGATSVSG